eukprot:13352068-Alexandrium_andersonii.AAC.1
MFCPVEPASTSIIHPIKSPQPLLAEESSLSYLMANCMHVVKCWPLPVVPTPVCWHRVGPCSRSSCACFTWQRPPTS